ncbi:MAG: UDP-N-acetylmuramoyl-L-alanine--D-glutamate ligase, partial [Candidatus Levybacteria bacterium]|nr:UDP-N-acetylmuramoyl-L-alanine--D-glutamate ligase [Candidatus Levybacteria bacterium]
MDFGNKKIAVLGAGVEGFSSAVWLKKHGAKVTLLDKNQGENYLEGLEQYDMIVRSPGVKLNLPQIQAAKKKGVEITSQTKIFFDLCPGKIIGVTGTKGKGTTSSLIYEMLKKDNKNVFLGGNIGEPPLNFLDKISEHDWVVLELSSFQLQDLQKSPHIALMLMVTSEHLDYHKDIQEYIEAKRNILAHQSKSDYAILNRDYPATNESDIHTNAKLFYVSREREVERGCFVKNNKVIIRLPLLKSEIRNPKSETNAKRFENSNLGIVSRFDIRASNLSSYRQARDREVINVSDILLPGRHNLENVCAAVVAASLAGVRLGNIVHVLKTFGGLEHRLELVREVLGVRFYDDSFSTTPETAIAAIEAFEVPEIIILGGSSKGSDFTELGRVIRDAKNIKAIIGIGVEWVRIKEGIRN